MKKGKLFALACLGLCFLLIISACQSIAPFDDPPVSNHPPGEPPVAPPKPPIPPPVPKPSANLDNTLRPFDGFRRNNQNLQPEIYMPRQYIEAYDCVVLGSPLQKRIYLTFDAGYEAGFTGKILDALQAECVTAAFFLTGDYIKKNPTLVQRMHREGHVLANHSMTHPHLSQVDLSTLEWEVSQVEILYQQLGVDSSPFLRPPYGSYSQRTLAWTRYMGYINVFWSMAYKDWDEKNQPGADYAYNHVITNLHPGAVILLHTNSGSNAEAMARILAEVKAKGYEFGSLYEFIPAD
jgi:peptidoglycan-N-acetylmuramic acid deacetylase